LPSSFFIFASLYTEYYIQSISYSVDVVKKSGAADVFPILCSRRAAPLSLTLVPWRRKGTAAGIPPLALKWEQGQGENKKVAFARQTYP
jgi:hypothetical protein